MALDLNDAGRILNEDTRQAIEQAVSEAKARGWTQAALQTYFGGLGVSIQHYAAARGGSPVPDAIAHALSAVSVHGLPAPNRQDILRHLEWLTEPARGAYDDALVEIAWAPDPADGDVKAARLFGLDELDAAADFSVATNNRGLNLYVGAVLRLPDAPRDRRGKTENFYVATALRVDIDADYDATRSRLAAVWDDGLVVRTGLIPERRSQHWSRLVEPCTDDLEFAHACRAVVDHVGADQKVKDAARVMRLGGTVSFPSTAKLAKGYRVEVTTVATPSQARLTSLDSVRTLAPAEDLGRPFDASTRPVGSGEIERGEDGRVFNGRETYFRDLLLTVVREFQARTGVDPDTETLFTEAFARFTDEDDVDNGDGRWTSPAGQAQLRHRATNTVRRLKAGYLAPCGLWSRETGRRREEAEAAAHARDIRDFPFAHKKAAQPWEPDVEPSDDKDVLQAQQGAPSARPVTLFDPWVQFPAPGFPLDTLPSVLRDFAETQAISTGADVAAFAMASLAVCSGALDHRFSLKMKRTGSWSESPRIWVVCIGPSSARKSPVLSAATAPLQALDLAGVRAHAKDVARWKTLKDQGDRSEAPPEPTQYIANSTTSEMLTETLSRQPRGVLVVRDELSGWFGEMEKYGGGKASAANRAFWLQSYNGGPLRNDTISRGRTHVENCSVSLLGGIQPAVLQSLNPSSDGMLQRFLPVMMRRAERSQEIADEGPTEAYADLIAYLATMRPAQLIMDDDALEAARAFQGFTYDLEMTDGLGESLVSFIGKLNGLHGRLSLLLHVVQDPKESPYRPLNRATVEAAARILREFTLPHALHIYQGSADSVDWELLRSVASYILTSDRDRFVVSDFTSGVRGLRGASVWEVQQKVSPLVAGGWLCEEDVRGVVKAWGVVSGVRGLFGDRRHEEATRKERAMAAFREMAAQGGQHAA